MLRIRLLWLVAIILTLSCRGPRPGTPKNLPPPLMSTSVGPGDIFEVYVAGEKDIPKEFRVQPDGSIDFPYLNRVVVAGLEPQEIVDVIRKRLVAAGVLRDPQVTLVVKQYNSKKVIVIGQLQRPGSISWIDGMKLVDVISAAGGFTAIADSNHVILNRHLANGKIITVVVSVDAITDGAQADVPLQAGDTIKVESRAF